MAHWSGVVRESDGASGHFKERLTRPHVDSGSQINKDHSGFRNRKIAMHDMDGDHHLNDSNIEDRKGGDEPAFEKRPANEEKEIHEGVKEVSGKVGREYKD